MHALTLLSLSLSLSLSFSLSQTPFPAVLYLYLSRRMNHTSIFTHQPCRWYTENWSDSSYGLLTHSIFVPIVSLFKHSFQTRKDDERIGSLSNYAQLLHLIFQLIITRNSHIYIYILYIPWNNQSYKPFKKILRANDSNVIPMINTTLLSYLPGFIDHKRFFA